MNITIALYSFYDDKVYIKVPFKIIKETEKCYFTEKGRYLKSQIGETILHDKTHYPYLQLTMIDADEKELRDVLSKWFTEKAFRVWRMFDEDNDVRETE